MSAARWTGVPLSRVLERVRPLARASQILISGFDEHTVEDAGSVPGASWIFGLDPIRASGAFLATGMNGATLRPEYGFPLRLVVPGWYACTAIKWVNEIAFVDADAPATDQMREYAGRTHQDPVGPRDLALTQAGRRPEGPPLARDFQPASIDPAALPVRVEKRIDAEGRIVYRVVGIQWGTVTPVPGLQIRFDAEQDWALVEETGRVATGTWSLWSHTFRPKRPGRYRIELQVTGAGVRTRRLDAGYYTREIEIESV
jgi:DMSO/TMAO reductase YedYZ molybdopterin-dependent catalytic subunit